MFAMSLCGWVVVGLARVAVVVGPRAPPVASPPPLWVSSVVLAVPQPPPSVVGLVLQVGVEQLPREPSEAGGAVVSGEPCPSPWPLALRVAVGRCCFRGPPACPS